MKLNDRKIGPCKVLGKINENAYQVELPPHCNISNVFNVKHLRPYYAATTRGQVISIKGRPDVGS